MGDRILRGKMIEIAWVAIRKDPELKEFYDRVFRSNPGEYAAPKAIVAVARKLTARICSVLKSRRPYCVREAVHQ